ncbi:Nitric oxide-dependent regulator DnrN or NorA [Thioalkalivibrio nitratireducens DSM 14787]|uniref:Nitric oxide-dependent regulator DnrN or NorA n=1 Tax=Thioalkalivibrio nitratireducens (strain DSM 14787 / UNIQEM 213 / ALEN2) TaxID=1255043 RepID=L0DTL7_THIND|nr:hemerythrin domain-containing protein [Thioalkalivibrio nitratireducens]AGA32934.1 Nitric oxide-dependent regulator DnrN or NorA [Thioalkalivibrio nitratireducens DSM 14787]
MIGIQAFLTDDHRSCDRAYTEMESALATGNRDGARSACDRFIADMKRHFQREEAVLFPRFETVTGMRDGPTRAMKMEHDQMRGLMDELAQAVANGDHRSGLGTAETLLMMIQQHNLKEEQVLYPMAGRALDNESAELIERMTGMGT